MKFSIDAVFGKIKEKRGYYKGGESTPPLDGLSYFINVIFLVSENPSVIKR